ncbi:MAG: (Fe-S)-binding protein [Phycisphaeraceae bacterium]
MRVALFITCLTDTFYPRTGIAVVKVLEHLGCQVDFPQAQTCCGQPMYNNGFHDDARDLARRLVSVFEDAEYVVCPSGSCTAMIHDYYPELLRDDPAYAHAVDPFVHKVYEFSRFLTEVLKVDLRQHDARWPGTVTYHYSCHLRGIGVKSPILPLEGDVSAKSYAAADLDARGETSGGMAPLDDPAVRLLHQIQDLQYVQLAKADQCCGFGGTFATKMPTISGAMVRDKVDCIRATGAPVCVSSEGGCTMNIAGSAHRQGVDVHFKSLAEIIAESLGLMEPEDSSQRARRSQR